MFQPHTFVRDGGRFSFLAFTVALFISSVPVAEAKELCNIERANLSGFAKFARIISDVNGDGYNDIFVCASDRALIFGGDDCSQLAEIVTRYRRCHTGTAVDLNADGNPEIIIGNPDFDNEKGAIEVYTRPDTASSFSYLTSWGGNIAGDRFGHSIASIRTTTSAGTRLSGNGIGGAGEDFIVGAPGAAVGSTPRAGVVHVFEGQQGVTGSGILRNTRTLSGGDPQPQTGDEFGYAIDAASINGDTSIAVGMPGYRRGADLENGMVQLFIEGTNNDFAYRNRYMTNQAYARFGASVAFTHASVNERVGSSRWMRIPHMLAGIPGHMIPGGSNNAALRNGDVAFLDAGRNRVIFQRYAYRGSHIETRIGDTVASLGDVNADGSNVDLAFGTFPTLQSTASGRPYAKVWNTRGRRLNHTYGTTVSNPRLGTDDNRVMVAAGDITKDDRPELLRAIPGQKRVIVEMIGGIHNYGRGNGMRATFIQDNNYARYRLEGVDPSASVTVHASLAKGSVTLPDGTEVCIKTDPSSYLTSAVFQANSQGVVEVPFRAFFATPRSIADESVYFQSSQLVGTDIYTSNCTHLRAGINGQ
jgi:hypothetical protein